MKQTIQNSGFSRRHVLRIGTAALAAPFILRPQSARSAQSIVVASYGGGWAEAMTEAFHKPFTKETGIEVVVAAGTDLAKARAQVQTKNVEWDVVELSNGWLATGMRDGLWEKVDTGVVDMSGTTPGSQNEFAIGLCLVSGSFAWRTDKVGPGGPPKDWAGFWDAKAYPGRRGLMTRVTSTLEYALMADGVDAKKLYPLDVDRAFKSLDKIKPTVTNWVNAMPQTISLLQANEVDYVSSAAGRVFLARRQGIPLAYATNCALVDVTRVAILKGTKKLDLAQKHLAFQLRPDRQAHFAELTSYTPTKTEAIAKLSKELLELSPDLNGPKTAMSDEIWWSTRFDELTRRYKEWQLS
ncbi:ABC transporter substrate-binding protein [Microvirga pudoricolor]|uniref:ABC transporter substrate-binding protein n=1 Tax=Microvirga pudoricolor TaxID=2778729 RepID=UPI00194E75B2|nr:ABC transporter substrate-binding protein [Microvirga pudoricolor]MBM6593109.1 ABC transporter substrate-binding protein [Microvirga pudoricolor]